VLVLHNLDRVQAELAWRLALWKDLGKVLKQLTPGASFPFALREHPA